MREIYPKPIDDVDIAARYLSDRREPVGARPWIVVNMAVTIDGATALQGVSGGIGGPADHTAFHALRTAADAIVAGAGTMRAENYGPVRVPAALVEARRRTGREQPARLVSISRSCAFDPAARLFTGQGEVPLIYTVENAPTERVEAVRAVAEVVMAGRDEVDLNEVFADLGRRGVRCVVCEGGPTLNGHLIDAGLVDEWCITFGPLLAAGPSARSAHSPDGGAPHGFVLDRLITDGRDLLARYVVDRAIDAP